jgi:hypothetical protein
VALCRNQHGIEAGENAAWKNLLHHSRKSLEASGQ